YDLGVMNGAIGLVTFVGPKRGELKVRFDDLEVQYTPETIGELSLAYALTIHKSQGSEFPCVVVLIHKAHSFMHHRNLFYTGLTRARQVAVLIGDQWGMRNCAEKEQVERRKTFLSVLELPTARGGWVDPCCRAARPRATRRCASFESGSSTAPTTSPSSRRGASRVRSR